MLTKISNVVAKGRIFYCGPQLSRQKQKHHGKTKNLTAKTKYLTAKPKTSRQKQNTLRQNQNPHGKNKIPHGKTKNLTAKTKYLTAKPKTSRQNQILHSKSRIALVLPWKLPFKIMYTFCWSCPSATQYASLVPREWKPAKGLLHIFHGSMIS